VIEEYFRWAATTGASFVPAWSNASVALVALAAFASLFIAGAISQWQWLMDAAFLSLVAGGILVAWPAMVALSIAAVLVSVAVSLLYRVIAPRRSAEIDAEAGRRASAAVADFAREIPGGEDALRSLRDRDPKA
jgi:hypothetical protein